VGIFRVREDMEKALGELGKLNERWSHTSVEGSRMFNPGWHLALDLRSMLTISEAVTRSALVREESRGAHSRIDFPQLSPEWGTKNNIVARGPSGMTLRQSTNPEPPAELKALLAEDK
jgi:succinate dehydrogenase / fumarate reductase, flavoprotein subunit